MTAQDEITIREAADQDGPAIAALVAGVFAEYENVVFEPSEFPELAAPASHYGKRNGKLWVVERDGHIVGSFAICASMDPAVYEIFKVYLHASLRGRGVAKDLLRRGIDHARAAGARRIRLWSDAKFRSGHAFYERNGFVRLPGIRALHDVSHTLEYSYLLDLAA